MEMVISELHQSRSSQFGHAGLALIGELARISGIDELSRDISKAKQPQITDEEIIRALCGLLCQGKTDFDQIKEFREDSFFLNALNLARTPSPEILRQRFQALSLQTELEGKLPECSLNLWNQLGMKPEYISHNDRSWVRMDIDAVIFDNDDTKKEGAEFTYNNQFGFNPVFAHLGGGWMVNARLRPGSAHSLAPGTKDFIFQSLHYGKSMVQDPLLLVMDSGFDSQDVILDLINADMVDFIVKHNLRQESKEEWLETAKTNYQEMESFDTRQTSQNVYRGSISRKIKNKEEPVRMVFEVREITSRKGQLLLVPEIKVFAAWTSLDLPEKDILKTYRDRGTSEQYHAEFKDEMDMERLPSGKFKVNSTFLLLGMLVYNMLKVIAQDMVVAKALGLKKATRRRLKTVMRSVIFMCGKITRHARKLRLHLGCPDPWFSFFRQLFFRLRAT
jgi:hypothetical protein